MLIIYYQTCKQQSRDNIFSSYTITKRIQEESLINGQLSQPFLDQYNKSRKEFEQ